MADGTVLVLSGAITAVNPADGSVKWTYSPSGPYYSSYGSVSVNPSGNVIFAFDRFLGKLQSNGTRVWELEFLGGASANELESTASSPLLDASGNIYLGLGTGKRSTRPWGKVLRAYNAAGGTRWEYTLGEGTYTSAPALGTNGTLYVGCMDGNLYAFGTPDKVAPRLTSPQLTQPAAFTFTLTGEANSIYHIEASDDLVNWTRVLSVTNPTMPALVTVPTPPGKPCQFWRAVMQ
jgi:outer membrane protein assembly factor BamB